MPGSLTAPKVTDSPSQEQSGQDGGRSGSGAYWRQAEWRHWFCPVIDGALSVHFSGGSSGWLCTGPDVGQDAGLVAGRDGFVGLVAAFPGCDVALVTGLVRLYVLDTWQPEAHVPPSFVGVKPIGIFHSPKGTDSANMWASLVAWGA